MEVPQFLSNSVEATGRLQAAASAGSSQLKARPLSSRAPTTALLPTPPATIRLISTSQLQALTHPAPASAMSAPSVARNGHSTQVRSAPTGQTLAVTAISSRTPSSGLDAQTSSVSAGTTPMLMPKKSAAQQSSSKLLLAGKTTEMLGLRSLPPHAPLLLMPGSCSNSLRTSLCESAHTKPIIFII